MTAITKKAIIAALKELTRTKSFDKISISDITKACGLNRQTFYYHFQDKYELLNWIYYNECFVPIMDGISFENWDLKMLSLLRLMKSEPYFYRNTIQSDEANFHDYLLDITSALFSEVIGEQNDDNHLDLEDKKFFSRFYAYGICGIITRWVLTGMKEAPEELASHFKKLTYESEKTGNRKKYIS